MQSKILIVATNCNTYEIVKRPTGLWLGEFVHAYTIFNQHHIAFDIASPKGGAIPLDPESLKGYAMDKEIKTFYADAEKMKLLQNTICVNDIDATKYNAIYYTGGHGTMWDFLDNNALQNITSSIYQNDGIVSAVCHGVAGLLNVKLSDGKYLIASKNITGYSNLEERLIGTKKIVPFLLQDKLTEKGAHYQKGILPYLSKTVQDGRLLTGQNPFSTKALAKMIVQEISLLNK
jgi:putative intracellular protease/amidase